MDNQAVLLDILKKRSGKPIHTANFNIIDKSGRNYIATADTGIANINDSSHGTTKKVEGAIAGLVKQSKILRETDFNLGDYNLGPYIQNIKNLLLTLNEVGDKQIIISRNIQNER